MNLYAISPAYAPHMEVRLTLAENHNEAMEQGELAVRWDDELGYGSPTAAVYLIAEDVKHIGDASPSPTFREDSKGKP